MLEKATRICDAKFATLYLSDGDTWRAVAATRDAPPGYVQARKRNILKLSPGGPLEQVVDTKQVVHIADMKELRPYRERHPTIVAAVELGGFRLVLWFPCSEMTNSSAPLASFGKKSDLSQTNRSSYCRTSPPRPSSPSRTRGCSASCASDTDDLSESLEQQTATSEVLRSLKLARRAGAVFQAMLENATHICEARFGNLVCMKTKMMHFGCRRYNGAPPELAEKAWCVNQSSIQA